VAALRARAAWDKLSDHRGEICDCLSFSWGYHERNDANHVGPDEATAKLAAARARDCHLLINTAPLPDGSIPEPDAATLAELGRRIRAGEIPTGDPDAAFGETLPTIAPIS